MMCERQQFELLITFLSQHNIYIFYTPRHPIPLIYILHSLLRIFYVLALKFYLQNIYKFIHIFLEILPI